MRKLSIPALVFALVIAAGCGGKKNTDKSKPGNGQASGATVSGRVDLYSGFGLDLDRSGLSKKLNQGTLVKLYRFTGTGTDVTPVDGITPRPIEADGKFTISNTPSGEINLIVTVESPAGQPILSALLPSLPSQGVNDLIISPETDLEVKVFKQILQQKSAAGATLAGLTFKQLDAAFVKQIVTADAVFDSAVQSNTDAAAQRMGGAAVRAYAEYVETLAGPGRPVTDPAVDTVTTAMRAPMETVLFAQEHAFVDATAPRMAPREQIAALLQAAGDAAEQMTVNDAGLSRRAILLTALDRRLARTAECMSANAAKTCPAPATGTLSIDAYAASLTRDVSAQAANQDLILRVGASSAASGTFTVSVTAALDDLQKLLALPDPVVDPLRALANAPADALAQPGADAAQLRETALRHFAIIRDYALTGFLGMDESSISTITNQLVRNAGDLSRISRDSSASMNDISARRKALFAQVDSTLTPIATHIRATYDKLPELEQNKILQSVKSLILCASLGDVPAVFLEGPDSDRDGVPDETEITIGTNPDKAESLPAPVTTASPETLLPQAPVDADQDGILDIVELMQGTDPDDGASKPEIAGLVFCSKSARGFPCPGAGAGTADQSPVTFDLSGQIIFEQSPAQGVTVGLYHRPVFLSQKPVFASNQPSSDKGGFSLQAPAGRYFVAAFIDTNDNMTLDKGEAAGFLGALYPEHITLDQNIVLASAVEMIGLAGGAPCQNGAWLSPQTGACEDQCPGATEPDTLTGSCRCADNGLYAVTTRACAATCPENTVRDAGGRRCVCPAHSLLDEVQSTCHCAVGLAFDAEAGACACPSGYFQPQTESCVESCPGGMPANQKTRACECPESTQFDQAAGVCACPGNAKMNTLTGQCESNCPRNTVVDSTGRACVCPPNQKPGRAGQCECQDGFIQNLNTGECTAPAPDSASRTAPGKKNLNHSATSSGSPPGSGAQPAANENTGDANPETMPDDSGDQNPASPGTPQPADTGAGVEAGHTITDPGADMPPGFIGNDADVSPQSDPDNSSGNTQ